MKTVKIYQSRRGELLIDPLDLTSAGVGISSGTISRATMSAPPATLGYTVISALNAAGNVVPHPSVAGGTLKQNGLFALAGVKNWPAFVRAMAATTVNLMANGEEVCVSPMTNLGPRTGYVSRDTEQVCAEITDPEAVGRAVLYALKVSTFLPPSGEL
jgi:hypothetical protein